MNLRCTLSSLAFGASLLLTAGAALALETPQTRTTMAPAPVTPSKSANACFNIHDWSGWRAVDDKTLLIRVNIREIWRIDLSYACSTLTAPDAHLVTEVRGSEQICHAIDLDLSVADSNRFKTPCFVKDIHLLTPEEVAATPKKDLP